MLTLVLAASIPAGYWVHEGRLKAAIEEATAHVIGPTVAAQIHQESTWRADVFSPVGAGGLAQFMPGSRDWWFPKISGCRDAPVTDPDCSLRASIAYTQWHGRKLQRFASRLDQLGAMLASYNAGMGWILKERRLCAADPDCDPARWFGHVEDQCLRNPRACAESRHYSRRILQSLRTLYDPLP